jgi:cytochrome c-type biogenesis protein CcmH/NrfG
MSKKMYDDALAVMRKGVEALPDNIGIRIVFGDIYEKMGMANKAVEAYEKALVIEPNNKEARRKIDAIRKKTGI